LKNNFILSLLLVQYFSASTFYLTYLSQDVVRCFYAINRDCKYPLSWKKLASL